MPKTYVKPLIYDAVHQEHLPASEGQYMDKAFIPVDESVPNALSVTEEGLRVTADALVSEAPDNQLKAQDGKLYVAPVEVPDPTPGELVSADEGNLLGVGLDGKLAVNADNLPKQNVVSADEGNIVREGTDGGAFVDGNDLLSNGDINLLTISEVDNKIILRKKDVLANLTVVSDDPGNLIGTGSDGGVYMSKDELISEDDDVLTTDSHGKLVTELDMDYNTTTGELRLLGVDGAEVGHAIVPTSTSALRSVEFTRSMPSADGEDVEGDYYVTLAFKFDSQDSWDGGDGVKFTTVKGTPAVQNVDYDMKSTVGSGVFPDHVKAVFMGQMVEQDIEAGTPNTIDFPDGSRLILTWNSSTGTSINFQASFTPGIGIELGSYLRMAWLLADGSVQDVYLEMTDIYSAGDGISIDDTGLVSVVVSSTGGLQNGPDGVGVKVDPDGGLQTSEEGTSIKVDADGGLQTTEDGTAIKIVSTGGLQTNENGTSIKVDPEGGLQTGEAGTSIKTDPASGLVTGPDGTGIDDTWLDNQVTDQIRNTELVTAGNGIDVTTTETGKQVAVVGSDSINSTEAGIAVDDEWLAQQITDKVKEDTSLVTADDSINVTPTGTGVQVGVDTGWLDEQITEQIKNDETLLVKGNGITLTPTATGREIAADAGTGVTVDENGINVDQTWLNNRITDKVKGDATLITGSNGIDTTLTATGTQVSVNDEWLADQITEQVRTDTGLIQAGNGITINVTDAGKTISANAGTGIVADTNGISVNEEWLADKVTEQVRTDANLVVAGDGLTEVVGAEGKTLSVNPGAGISVTGDAVTVDTAWLTEQLDTRVESGGFVTAGDGIDVTASDGKAEVAVDDTVVRTSGNQTIAGNKTFTSGVVINVNAGEAPNLDLKFADTVVKGTTPDKDYFGGMVLYHSAGGTNGSLVDTLMSCMGYYGTDGDLSASLRTFKPEAGSIAYAEVAVIYPQSGDPYAIAPKTPDTAAGGEIVTANYLKGANSGVVHTTGNESVSGTKTFASIYTTSDLAIDFSGLPVSSTWRDTPNLICKTAYTKGEEFVSQATYGGFVVNDSTNSELGTCIVTPFTDRVEASLVARKNDPDADVSTYYAAIRAICPTTGDPYAVAPSTRATPADNEIVTVDYLKGTNSGVVHTTGNETIGGDKTFTGVTTFYPDIQLVGSLVGESDDSPQIDMIINITKGTAPSRAATAGLRILDNADNNFALLYSILATDGTVTTGIRSYRNDASANSAASISTVYPKTGDPYATAPNTRSTPSANEIITYDFLQQYVEANGGGSLGAVLDAYYVPVSAISSSHTPVGSGGDYGIASFRLPSGGTWVVTGYFVEAHDYASASAPNIYYFGAGASTYSSGAFPGQYATFAGGTLIYCRCDNIVIAGITDKTSSVICFRVA